jgi:hypothetical protein
MVAWALVVLTGGAAWGDAKQMQQLVPDAQRARVTDRTYVFSRTQAHSSLGSGKYLHKWIDRPLLVDPALDKGKPSELLMSPAAFEVMQKTVLRYGMDGFAFFPETTRRIQLYGMTRQNALPGFQLLSAFGSRDGEPSKAEVVKTALATPGAFRIDGKLVITSYRGYARPPEAWAKLLGALRKEYGDKIIFLPGMSIFDDQGWRTWQRKYHANQVTKQDVEGIKANLRRYAQATDGLYFDGAAMLMEGHKFDEDFYSNFLIRLMKSVLAEPQFKGKYLGLSAVKGHENNTRFGYTLSADATKTLRHSFEAAMGANPDLIVIPEWDEQNENTSLRPTVYDGLSSMRMLRYYTAKMGDQKPPLMEGDDTSIPNLVVSYRKMLVLGEKLEVELLNIPDSSENGSYTVKVVLEDGNGKTVYTAPPQTLDGREMKARTITLASEQFAADHILRPKLEIEAGGRTIEVEDGLHYIDLRPTSTWDYQFVKQPLRDLIKPKAATFEVGTVQADGTRMARGTFESPEPLRYVEVLSDDDVVYSYAADDAWRENKDQIIVRMSWKAFGGRGTGLRFNGTIALQNAKGRWAVPGDEDMDSGPESVKDQTITFKNAVASVWWSRTMVAIPRSQIEQGVFAVDLPGIFKGSVRVKDLMAGTVYGIPGPKGFNLVLSRYVSQDQMPVNVNGTQVSFDVPVMPDFRWSVLHVQAIGKSGHEYRGRPVALEGKDEGTKRVTVYSDSANKAVEVEVRAGRVPDIQYEFNPSHGSALVCDAGRGFWGILGGYFAQVTGRGGGAAGDSTPFIKGSDHPADAPKTAPDWVKLEDGSYALQFDGKGTYVSLPQSVIPRRAGFTIDMDIRPEVKEGRQVIIAKRSYYPGSLTVYMDGGVLKADYAGELGSRSKMDSGLSLPIGQWSHLTIRSNQKELVMLVNGKAGKTLAAAGPGTYDTAAVVGGFGKDWFKGRIKSLRVRHTVAVQ